nr:MAG: hypothetical protein [Bacteriophage sp.]
MVPVNSTTSPILMSAVPPVVSPVEGVLLPDPSRRLTSAAISPWRL